MGYFKTWIDNPTTGVNGNILTKEEFDQLTARQTGFASGTTISSKEVNSALRQANLVATALMETIAPNYQSGSLESSVNQIKFAFSTYFDPLIGSVTYDDATHTLTVVHRNGATETYTIDVSSGTVESAVKDGAGNVITETYETKTHAAETYATKTEVEAQESWSEEYSDEYQHTEFCKLRSAYWDNWLPDSSGENENMILLWEHEITEVDNIIISIDKSATKAQCEAFYDALIVPAGIEENMPVVKALGDIPSIDIPVTVMRV